MYGVEAACKSAVSLKHPGDTPGIHPLTKVSVEEVSVEEPTVAVTSHEEASAAAVGAVTRDCVKREKAAEMAAVERDSDVGPEVVVPSTELCVERKGDAVVESRSTKEDVLRSLGSPSVLDEAGVDELRSEVLGDESLESCRKMADKEENGFIWSAGFSTVWKMSWEKQSDDLCCLSVRE